MDEGASSSFGFPSAPPTVLVGPDILSHDRMLDPDILKSVLRVFKHNATVIARDTGQVYSSELMTVLQDAIASVTDETPDNAFMVTGECVTGCSVIDQDRGVWATLDEGCNSNCHGRARARNAEERFAEHKAQLQVQIAIRVPL